MTVVGRRRAAQAINLDGFGFVPYEMKGIMSRRASHVHIIHAHSCCVVIAYNVAVECYHGHSAFIHFLYCRCQCRRLIGSHNDYVETVFHEIFNIGNLLGIVIG